MNEHTNRAQDREIASKGLQGVREAGKRDKGLKFTTLLHHVNGNLLRDSFYLLKKRLRGEWRAGKRTCTNGFIGERTGRSPHGESTYPNQTGGNARSGLRHWKTKSCSRLDQWRSLQEVLSGDKV
jgi:hypothetical protein